MSNLILPGLIDPHVHLRDPGQTQKEDFYTGTSAALAGGYTTILDMPNNKVPITTLEKLEKKIKIAKEKIVCDVGFYFGSIGENLGEFEKLFFYSSSERERVEKLSLNSSRQARTIKNLSSLIFGLKLYLNRTTGNFIIEKNLLESIFTTWLSTFQSMSLCSSILSTKNVKPILVHAEEKRVEDVINIVKKVKIPTHFCHISRTDQLKMILKAKEEGLPVTCGVTPHHLFLTEKDAKILGPFAKMKPPLSSKKDQDFLWKNLSYIDVIESDHAPHTIEEKQSNKPPFGVPGLETTLPLLLTAVSEKRLAIEDIIRLCYRTPAKIFGIKTDSKTKIEVDLNWKFEIARPERSRGGNLKFHTKCGWSPFNGWKVKGKVKRVFIRGEKVFEDDKILAKPGFGKVVSPKF
jgi:carbamoyl-phosphate synthase/aspartate carbamoyltransferase/dihydroorotase